jgi:hypothetical protein
MILTQETIGVLRNFAQINENLMVRAGSSVMTKSPTNTIYGESQISEEFPMDFGIYSLSEFLGAVSLFEKSPELKFEEKYVSMSDDTNSVKFYYAAENVLVFPKNKVSMPEADYTFTLKAAEFSRIMKAASTLRSGDICISGRNGTVSVTVADKKNPTANSFDVTIGDLVGTGDFSAYLKLENLKLVPGEYRVSISKRKLTEFVHANGTLRYAVAVESDSKL